jgi:predicted nucleic acid-binding Zn ribbon protein
MTDPKRQGPMAVAEVLSGYLKRSGLEGRLAQARVIPDWARLVGPQIAAVTLPDRVAPDGTLFVGVQTSAWMTELQLMAPTIIARVNAGRGDGRIRGIRWFLSPQ